MYTSKNVRCQTYKAQYQSPIETIIQKLENVSMYGADRWKATCPAHDDNHPSLSVRVLNDGKVLLHCWAGCPISDVVNCMDLSLADLFPHKNRSTINHAGRLGHPFNCKDAFHGLTHEILVAHLIVEVASSGKLLSVEQRDRLRLAEMRISSALALVEGSNERN